MHLLDGIENCVITLDRLSVVVWDPFSRHLQSNSETLGREIVMMVGMS